MNLKSEQRRLYDMLPADAGCFVRVCSDDTALWVSDLPRRMEVPSALTAQLGEAGFVVRPDEKNRLWYLDWTQKRWLEMLQNLPQEVPVFPERDELHEIYALCRLLLLHPAPLEDGHLPLLRRMVKLTSEQPSGMFRAVRSLYEETAVSMRCGRTAAYAAGRILAAWLHEQANE